MTHSTLTWHGCSRNLYLSEQSGRPGQSSSWVRHLQLQTTASCEFLGGRHKETGWHITLYLQIAMQWGQWKSLLCLNPKDPITYGNCFMVGYFPWTGVYELLEEFISWVSKKNHYGWAAHTGPVEVGWCLEAMWILLRGTVLCSSVGCPSQFVWVANAQLAAAWLLWPFCKLEFCRYLTWKYSTWFEVHFAWSEEILPL